jgi:hypothetical protein
MFSWYLSHSKSKEKGRIWPVITNGFSRSGVQAKVFAMHLCRWCLHSAGLQKTVSDESRSYICLLKTVNSEQNGELLYLKEADADESFHPTTFYLCA